MYCQCQIFSFGGGKHKEKRTRGRSKPHHPSMEQDPGPTNIEPTSTTLVQHANPPCCDAPLTNMHLKTQMSRLLKSRDDMMSSTARWRSYFTGTGDKTLRFWNVFSKTRSTNESNPVWWKNMTHTTQYGTTVNVHIVQTLLLHLCYEHIDSYSKPPPDLFIQQTKLSGTMQTPSEKKKMMCSCPKESSHITYQTKDFRKKNSCYISSKHEDFIKTSKLWSHYTVIMPHIFTIIYDTQS